jgi:hypothetical protein
VEQEAHEPAGNKGGKPSTWREDGSDETREGGEALKGMRSAPEQLQWCLHLCMSSLSQQQIYGLMCMCGQLRSFLLPAVHSANTRVHAVTMHTAPPLLLCPMSLLALCCLYGCKSQAVQCCMYDNSVPAPTCHRLLHSTQHAHHLAHSVAIQPVVTHIIMAQPGGV